MGEVVLRFLACRLRAAAFVYSSCNRVSSWPKPYSRWTKTCRIVSLYKVNELAALWPVEKNLLELSRIFVVVDLVLHILLMNKIIAFSS